MKLPKDMNVSDKKHLFALCIVGCIFAVFSLVWGLGAVREQGLNFITFAAFLSAAVSLFVGVYGLFSISSATERLTSFVSLTKLLTIALLIVDVLSVLIFRGERNAALSFLGFTVLISGASFILSSNIIREGGLGVFEMRAKLPKSIFSDDSQNE